MHPRRDFVCDERVVGDEHLERKRAHMIERLEHASCVALGCLREFSRNQRGRNGTKENPVRVQILNHWIHHRAAVSRARCEHTHFAIEGNERLVDARRAMQRFPRRREFVRGFYYALPFAVIAK